MKNNDGIGYRIFIVFNYIILALVSFTMLYPYLNVLAKAFNEGADTALGGITFWPREWTLENFTAILSEDSFFRALGVTVARVVLATLGSLLVQFAAAYTMAKKNLMLKTALTFFFMIPGYIAVGVIPTYVLYSDLGLLNSFWVYVLPGLFSFYNMIIIRTYMQSNIPDALYEAAYLDGATDVTIFFKIVLPLTLPVMATIALWTMVGQWNDWTTTLYYITTPKLHTLQFKMMQVVKESEYIEKMRAALLAQGANVEDMEVNITSDSLISAQVIITTVPIIAVYPFLQKYFVKGVTLGSIKG